MAIIDHERYFADLYRSYLTAEGSTDTAGYEEGSTVINGAFTGTFIAGGAVKFMADDHEYRLDAEFVTATNPTSLTLAAPGLLQALPEETTAVAALGLDDDAALPRLCAHDGVEAVQPMIAIVPEQTNGKHPMLLSITVLIRLQVRSYLAPDDENPDGIGTLPAVSSAWVDALRRRLLDTDAFRAHLLSQSQEARTGRETLLRLPRPNGSRSDDPASHTTTWELAVEHKVNISPFNPPD